VSGSLSIDASEQARPCLHAVDVEALVARASDASKHEYAPYSHLKVGAALLTADGEVMTGGNVENGSYGMTICAERSAVVRAVAEGHREFTAIAVAADTDRVETLASCGACLQVLAECDAKQTLLVIFRDGDRLRVRCLSELLPKGFRLKPR
jgi:cytidine deaminase